MSLCDWGLQATFGIGNMLVKGTYIVSEHVQNVVQNRSEVFEILAKNRYYVVTSMFDILNTTNFLLLNQDTYVLVTYTSLIGQFTQRR
jgi:hypothetical protein